MDANIATKHKLKKKKPQGPLGKTEPEAGHNQRTWFWPVVLPLLRRVGSLLFFWPAEMWESWGQFLSDSKTSFRNIYKIWFECHTGYFCFCWTLCEKKKSAPRLNSCKSINWGGDENMKLHICIFTHRTVLRSKLSRAGRKVISWPNFKETRATARGEIKSMWQKKTWGPRLFAFEDFQSKTRHLTFGTLQFRIGCLAD